MKSFTAKQVIRRGIGTLASVVSAGFLVFAPLVAQAKAQTGYQSAHTPHALVLSNSLNRTDLRVADGNHSDGSDSQTADPKLQQVVRDDEKLDLNSAVTIDHGHVDIGPKMIDGKWRLVARDDSAHPPTWRDLNKTVFYLPKQSIQTLPQGEDYNFTGAKGGENVYTIPQTEIQGVPWLGWSTQSPQVVQNVDGQIQLTFEGHQGEGAFTNFLQAGLGGAPQVLWSAKTKQAQTINVDVNTHTHTNWVFTKPGVHLIRVTASATLKDGTKVTDSAVMRFAVGDKALVQQARVAKWTQQQTDPKAQAQVDSQSVAQENESKSLVWIIGGILLGIGILAALIAVIILRRAKRAQDEAIAKRKAASSSATPAVESVAPNAQISDSETARTAGSGDTLPTDAKETE